MKLKEKKVTNFYLLIFCFNLFFWFFSVFYLFIIIFKYRNILSRFINLVKSGLDELYSIMATAQQL